MVLTYPYFLLLQFCFCRKTSIQLGQATGKGVSLKREITVDSVALTLSMESGLICAALACGYYVMLNASIKNSKPIQLCTFDIRDKPLAIHVKKVVRLGKFCAVLTS